MKIAFHHSDKDREIELAEAVLTGAKALGHQVELRALGPDQQIGDCDLACMVGVKSRDLWRASQAAGARTMMLDKSYSRGRVREGKWARWRISLDAHQPTDDLHNFKRPSGRWDAMGIDLARWRKSGLQVLICGSSEKYHAFYDLPHPTEYWQGVIEKLREHTDRPIVYRPKPSWQDAKPLHDSYFSRGKEPLRSVLSNAHVMITHGSNACFEAMQFGVPTIALGPAICRPISSTKLSDVEAPIRGNRHRLLCNLAYFQWTLSEFRSGAAWNFIIERYGSTNGTR